MTTTSLATNLLRKSANPSAIADRVALRPRSLPEVFDGLRSNQARVKYGCLKVLRLISERNPGVLYTEFDRLVALLKSKNQFLRWGAIIVIGNLAVVDSEERIDRILSRYLRPIPGPILVTAANVIGGAGKIASAKPYLADKIARALMRVETASYRTAECRNVALGKAVESLGQFFPHLKEKRSVMEFVRRQLDNRRSSVRRKAATFLKQHALVGE